MMLQIPRAAARLTSTGSRWVQPARAMGTAFQAQLDEAAERDSIKEAVRDLCAGFQGSYWRELDKTSTYVGYIHSQILYYVLLVRVVAVLHDLILQYKYT